MDIKNKELENGLVTVRSFSFDATTLHSDISPVGDFKRGKVLKINARGIRVLRVPIPSRELEIAITDADDNVMYTSMREKMWSGNSILSNSSGADLVATRYFFGPSRDPVMYLMPANKEDVQIDAEGNVEPESFGPQIKTKSMWTSRRHVFTMPDGRDYEWRYGKEMNEVKDEKEKMLVLYERSEKGKGRRIAQLVRNKDTRTPGTRSCTAGNGGELVFDAERGASLDEHVVVATCLLMLKKEMDRRRAIQLIAMSAAASGGP